MNARGMTRRHALAAGLGLGVAAAVSTTDVPAAAAAAAGRPDAYSRVSMSMHTHSCFSEGGSFAGGGGGASMMAQLDQTTQNDIDVIWWTDHDWRMEAYGYYDGIAFDGTDEACDLVWVVQNEGAVGGATHAFVDEPHSPDEPGKAMRVVATGPAATWGASYLWADPGNSFYSTNLTDTTLSIDVLAEQVGPVPRTRIWSATARARPGGGGPVDVVQPDGHRPGRSCRLLPHRRTGFRRRVADVGRRSQLLEHRLRAERRVETIGLQMDGGVDGP